MKKLVVFLVTMLTTIQLQAQNELYVYQHNGVIDTLSMSNVTNISHSRYDSSGTRQEDFVMMNVLLNDNSERSYLLSQLDSVIIQRDGRRIHLTRFAGGMNVDGFASRKAPRRTSLDGDFMASSSAVDFFWEEGDNIFLEDNTKSDSVYIREGKATAEFFFDTEVTGDQVTVYYPGNDSELNNEVRVSSLQHQSVAGNSKHIGAYGDCGTAVAVRGNDDVYYFNLEHKASYLCFMPYIGNDLKRTVLKKIVVRSDSAIAGVFLLDPEKGMLPKNDTTHVITLTTDDFVLPQRASQNMTAFMVIAPQNGEARLTCEFTVYDTELQSTGVYTKMVDIATVEPNMVYVLRANCNNYVVDLGLPVKFLNHNMGAFAPEEYGGYYAFGELEDKGNYTTGNYTYQNTSYTDLGANIRLTDKDVAHVRLGNNLSMPTSAELNILKDSCTWTWQSSFNGVPGYKITGKNGNVLFMPAAGYRNGTANNDVKTRGVYRSSQLLASGQKKNWFLNFYSNSKSVDQSGEDIYLGESIRPVISTGVTMTDGTLVQVMTDSVQWRVGQQSANLFGSVSGITKAKTPVEVGFVVGNTQDITLENGTNVSASASTDGLFSASFAMPKDTVYFYRAYVRASQDSISYANTLQFGRCYVDLGLPSGTKWSNISLGTASPEQNGDYYAWGETHTKNSFPNDASNYRWYSHTTWIEPDRLLDIQATDNDAASINWGGVWMTPDKDDLQELVNNCDFTLATMNGMKGYVIKSRINDNSIFMSLSGYFRTAPSDYTTNGYMASSSLPGPNRRADHATILNNTELNNWLRTDGVPVRPVYKTNATSPDDKPMFIRTLVAAKQYDGQTETDTLKATVRGLTATTGSTVGFSYSTDKTFATDTKVTVSKTNDGQYSYVFNAEEPGVRTYYRAFVCSDGTYYYGDTLSVDAVGLVDLGLSVLWANVDIGAASADSHGDYFRWGATKPFLGDNSNFYTGNKNITPLSGHDTATEFWGNNFRMPTLAEFQELLDNCDVVTETSNNGVVGRRFTSKKEGYTDRSIFLPTSGVFEYNSSYRYGIGSENSHWTSTNYSGDQAYRVFIGNDRGAGSNKTYGFPVRPVQEKLASILNLGISRGMVNGVETTDTLKGYFNNVSGTSQTAGFLVGESRTLDKDNKLNQYDVTTANGNFLQVISNLTPGKRYYYRAFAHDDSEWKYTPVDSFDVVGEVDLGLSVKWANVNIGSQSEASYGKYYQWGAKETYISNSIVQYYSGGKNISPESGHDTATELWGGSWRMPSKEEWQELIDNCTWTWTNSNGQFGMRVTSNKTGYTDRSIFIPAAGYYYDGTHRTDNSGSGDYWTSSFYSGDRAYYQSFWNNGVSSYPIDPLYYGFTVRPVIESTIGVSSIDVKQDITDFTKTTIECYAKGTPSAATVGVLYGSSANDLSLDVPFATTGKQGQFAVTLTGLTSGATYYYAPYIKQGGSYIVKGDTLKFTTYELVNLDLPSGLMWMNLDLGADYVSGNGDYYQWGATVPYPEVGWNLCENYAQNLTESGRDAVRNTLGSPYRLPTFSEMEELVNNASWEWTTMNGVPGYKVSSNINSERFIFLPTTGWLNSSGALQYANTRGNYWSSTWNAQSSARDLGGGSLIAHFGDDGNTYDPTNYGSFLRPVLSVVETYKSQTVGSTYELRGYVNSVWGYGSGVRVGFVYSMSPSPTIDAAGSMDLPVSVSQSGDYSYALTSVGNNTTYYYRAYIFDGTNYYYGAEQSFVTMGASNYQAIDLGLPSGTKWANMNIGAETENGVGKFFAWGETYSKDNFSTGTYAHYDSYYKVIGEDIAGTKYDAARSIMGGAWTMPTKTQYDELLDSRYTKWEWVTDNGRNGYRVTSLVEGYTDRSIFIPASGWMNGTTLTGDNVSGYFWLSTFYNSDEAYYTALSQNVKGSDYDPRWEGFPIRGVINNGLTTADGTVAAVTTGVDWTIGASTATLHGKYGTTGTVSGATYGFVIGNSTDIDATTADASNIYTVSNANVAGDYTFTYNYDGGVRYFRAFIKVGDNYAQGEVKSIGAPMLLDIAFAADGTGTNYAFTQETCVKHGSPAISYNADYKRYEADLSANGFNATAGHYYSIRYNFDNDFMLRLTDGHTLEAVVKVPYLRSYAESDILANYENGGSGIGINNKTFFTQTYAQGRYHSVYDTDDLDDKTDTYHHIVSVYDKASASLLLYIDGQLVGSEPLNGDHTITTTASARYYMIGGNPDNYSNCVSAWNSSIVFARIYDDALTASQVRTLYDNLKK
jgi:uncharacterized protein (TIGR02145 family)